MKNHIVIKFFAVLLCAASLLGAVGSAAGIFGLTETDLYNKTVDQIYEERIRDAGRSLAYEQAGSYASRELGGCPVSMVQQNYTDAGAFNASRYGFQLKDAEGNVLASQEIPAGNAYTTYTFEVSGQYMYYLDSVTASEKAAEQEEPLFSQTMEPVGTDANGAVLWDAIPSEGAVIGQVQISRENSSDGASGDNLGTAFRNQDGVVMLRLPGWNSDNMDEPVTGIMLFDMTGALVYHAEDPNGVGMMYYCQDGTGDLIFQSFYSSQAAEPAVAFAMPAAEPALTEATEVPAETAEAATEPPTEATEAPTEETEVTEAATEETEEPSETEETVPEETKSKKKKSKTEETEAVTEPEEPKESDESTEATGAEKKSKKKTSSEEENVTEAAEETTFEAEAAATEEVEAAAYTETAVAEPAAYAEDSETEPTEPVALDETIPAETEPMLINGKPLEEYQINRSEYYDHATGEWTTARYVYVPMPEMTLELQVAPGALAHESSYTVLRIVRELRAYLLPALGACLLLCAIFAVYLCCAAGRKPKSDEIRPGGLNRIPLDLYGFLMILGVSCIGDVIVEGGDYLLRQNVMVGCAFGVILAFLASLLIVGFCFAFVAQIKTPGGFWWRNSLVGWCLKLCGWAIKKLIRFCAWLEDKASTRGWPLLKRMILWLWRMVCAVFRWCRNLLVRIYHWMYTGFNRFISLLPVTWQWLLAGCAMVFLLFITVAERYDIGIVLSILFAFALVLYGSHCFGVLMETTKKMNKGDLDTKVDDKLMVGAFKEFAGDLNDLAGVAVVAAQKQLKSERMKTELITNVSHDIKTPLTSIINYVDLLQKPHTEEEETQYLEVLDRQSQRLKKLIDDLMDMSKASTGNMAVDITLVDAVESVNQALGEFADKLDRAQLIPVFRHTEPSVAMMADGKLVWRVLSNLLSNAVKYAMPGTRLYIDLMSLENKVVISLKNISRDELNVDAEELMERFVRGDDSRNTEGSGLGLNIAKSLMELQKGQLQLLVDGDLFKVTLIFPGL